ncbi:putative Zn(II)2Cys6 transcription factor [Aspergillus pseudoustus]|uniref:Zn(II)2Cys6 transcription factor n=1 Tax=Aspergillus pseudoustus TaxID=1810923 RepID=A0ABR4KWU2_9EURO
MATLRKNGQQSSCEPCRTSKLRCDHSTPVCQRCVARNRADQCVYHPCPLTKPRDTRQRKEQARTSRKRNPSTTKVATGLSSAELYDWVERAPSVIARGPTPVQPKGTPLVDSGFLMSTTDSKDPQDEHQNFGSQTGILDDINTPQTDPRDTEVGAQILALFEHLSFFEEVIERRFDLFEGNVYGPQLLREALSVLKTLYEDAVRGAGANAKHARLLTWSRTIFQNTSIEIETTHPDMTLSEYVSLIAPRWDTISLVFAMLGTATYQISQTEEVLKREGMPGRDKHGLRKIAAAASDMCLQFSERLAAISDPLAWATIQRTILLVQIHGYADYRSWKSLGEVISVTLALGLHDGKVDEQIPFFLCEIRCRTMACAYAMDKDSSALLGRPPRICRRFCNFRYPMDMDWADIVADAPIREAAIQRLGPDGWDTLEHSGNECSRPRASIMSYILREMILEVSLGYSLDNLEDMLILSQAVAKLTGETPYSLIEASREILTVLLDAIGKRIRTGHVDHLLTCDLSYIGLPAAAALSKELLQRSLQPPTLSADVVPFPRSEIIQKLCVFAAHLEFFLPNRESDNATFKKGLQSIRSTLDAVLDLPSTGLQNNGASNLLPPGDGVGLPGHTTHFSGDAQGLEFAAFWEEFEFDWEGDRRVLFS